MDLKLKIGGDVTCGDNSKGQIERIGTIGNKSSIFIENVLLVNALKHNLLSISQLCCRRLILSGLLYVFLYVH